MADEENKSGPPEKRRKIADEKVVEDDEKPGCSKEPTHEDLEKNNNSVDDNSDNMSEISNLSGLSEEAWKPTSGAIQWIQNQIINGVNPRPILHGLIPDDTMIPEDMDDFMLWKIIITIMSEPEPRKKLSHVNTFQDVISLLHTCQNIMVLTGAGVSVSCGIPDFRSRDGIYARLAVDFPDLPDPQAMFDISYFRNDPRPFFKFAKEIYPGQFEPSRSHKFISTLEKQGKLLRNYTQNIDTLEQVAGISKIIQCHGSFATATCMVCKDKVDAEAVREDIFNQVIPKCPKCPSENSLAIMKPDIVFFGESLSDEFHKQMTADKDKCDLLIVIGSSLKVRPVALIPNSLPEDVPQILINREPLKHLNFDVELLGDCDTIIEELAKNLNWDGKSRSPVLHEILKDELKTPPPIEVGENTNDNCSTSKESCKGEEFSCVKSQRSDNTNETSCNVTKPDFQTEPPTFRALDVSTAADNKNHSKNGAEKTALNCTQVEQTSDTCEIDSAHPVDSSQSVPSSNDNGSENLLATRTDSQLSHSKDSKEIPPRPPNSSTIEPVSVNNPDVPMKTSDLSVTEEDIGDSNTEDKDDLEVMKSMWKPRYCSLAKRLGEKQYLFLPPSRYVFSGAEVYSDMEDNSGSDSSSDDSESDSIDVEEVDSLLSCNEKEDSTSQLRNGEKTDSINHKSDGSCELSNRLNKNGHELTDGDNSKEQSGVLALDLKTSAENEDSKPKSIKINGGMHQTYEELNDNGPATCTNLQSKPNSINQESVQNDLDGT